MKRICAWHPNNFGFTLVMADGTEPATHGICPDCALVEQGKVETQRLDSNAQFGEPFSPGSVPLNLDPTAGVGYDARKALPRDIWSPAMVQAHNEWMDAQERDQLPVQRVRLVAIECDWCGSLDCPDIGQSH